MHITPDQIVYWQSGFFQLNATILTTWGLMLFLALGSKLITRRLSLEIHRSRWQNALEIIVTTIAGQLKEAGFDNPYKYLGFLGTLFLFIASAGIFTVIPGYEPPTGSLSTTLALALCVFIAVPAYGISAKGLLGYLKDYAEPSVIMLPFNIISEISRTIALSIRLFGNMMSGTMVVAILLTVVPLIFPIFMTVLGLIIGMVQAYIFTILASVYIAAAIRTIE
ncbi:MAG: F0F1 ATP synthase subunit A [Syntrophomonadaceae bacterium]